MKVVALALLLLVGCTTSNPAPNWKLRAHAASEQATQDYLLGRFRASEKSEALAINALKKSGQPTEVAQAHLVFCALRVASLNFNDCAAFKEFFQDATPAQLAYDAFLMGRLAGLQVSLLPQHHQLVAAAAMQNPAPALLKIQDPLSRLVAAGVVVRAQQSMQTKLTSQAHPGQEVIQIAVDTASAQGWPQPLAAWLTLQEKVARAQGNRQLQATARRRLDLLLQP